MFLESKEFWEALILLFVGAAAGGFAGYHAGLKRASEAIWAACQAEAEAMSSLPPSPTREKVIQECLEAVLAVRPSPGQEGAMSMEDMERVKWVREGVDNAIDALQLVDRRGAGHYGVPRDVMDAHSRIALEQGEG